MTPENELDHYTADWLRLFGTLPPEGLADALKSNSNLVVKVLAREKEESDPVLVDMEIQADALAYLNHLIIKGLSK